MGGITGKGLKLLQEKQSGGGGVNEEVVAAMHPVLIGPALDVMNRKMTSGLCSSIETTCIPKVLVHYVIVTIATSPH